MQVLQGRSGLRKKLYIVTLVMESLVSILVLVIWLDQKRTLRELGFAAPDNWRFYVVLGIAILVALSYFRQWFHIVQMKGAFSDTVKAQLQPYAGIIPESHGERSLFALLSVVTGICEELLYRGYLIWYFSHYTNQVSAVLLSAFVFGIAHGYQGSAGIWRTMLWGVGLSILYLFSGSLFGPILLHAAMNICTGFIGSEILKHSDPQEV